MCALCPIALLLIAAPAAAAQAPPAKEAPAQAKELRTVQAALRQFEDGPPLEPGAGVGAGETVYFSFKIQNYKTSPDADVDLLWTVDALDPDGVKLVESTRKEIQTKISPQDKYWQPIGRVTFMVPPLALPGSYKMAVAVEDRLAKATAKAEIPFTVRARKVEPSPTLVARNFRFLRSEEDPAPLVTPAYHPGDAIVARFEITGYKYGEKNRIDVDYGIALANAGGRTLFQQPQAAQESKDSFYPQKYIPGVISFTSQKNTAPGEYTIVLTLRDHVGNQTVEAKHTFRLE